MSRLNSLHDWNVAIHKTSVPFYPPTFHHFTRKRCLLTLAIETSCDDTAVAVLETPNHAAQAPALNALIPSAALHFHEKVTANNKNNRGIHPLVAVKSHEANLALLVGRAISTFPSASSDGDDDPSQTIPVFSATKNWGLKKKPDFISVTRGPGMRSSLSVGLNHAKGLAVAWQIPLVGVNHMQAHALTPQLVSALASSGSAPPTPSFPFLSLLVSGGHTLLLHSRTLNDHSILASTSDTAIGDALDKMARSILPDAVIKSSAEIMYGRLLETFAFPDLDATDYGYTAPSKRCEELARKQTRWGWSLPVMLAETRSGSKSQAMLYTFCGLTAAVKRLCESEHAKGMSTDERVELAREAMRLAFEHLSSRIILALRQRQNDFNAIHSLVVSGGVASNQYLRTILRSYLNAHAFHHIQLSFPPPELCVDNAAMIAWAGTEMYRAGWTSDLSCAPLRKWSLDPEAEDGGVLGVAGWVKRDG